MIALAFGVLILLYFLKVLKNSILLIILTTLSFYFLTKYTTLFAWSLKNIILANGVVLLSYLFLEVLNIAFNIFSIIKSLFSILLSPFKIFVKKDDKKKDQ